MLHVGLVASKESKGRMCQCRQSRTDAGADAGQLQGRAGQRQGQGRAGQGADAGQGKGPNIHPHVENHTRIQATQSDTAHLTIIGTIR